MCDEPKNDKPNVIEPVNLATIDIAFKMNTNAIKMQLNVMMCGICVPTCDDMCAIFLHLHEDFMNRWAVFPKNMHANKAKAIDIAFKMNTMCAKMNTTNMCAV